MNFIDVRQRLEQELKEFTIGHAQFPLLFERGVDDAAVHACGVSYLLALGLSLGLPAVAEYPITIHADSHWKSYGRIFPDSVWFHPETFKPWIAFEFERFEPGDEGKIQDKVKNLALSVHQSQSSIEACILIFWLRSGFALRSMESIQKVFKEGFALNNRNVPPPKCSLLAYKFVLCQANNENRLMDHQTGEARAPYTTTQGSNLPLIACSSMKVMELQS